MTTEEVEKYLFENIPLTKLMGISVNKFDENEIVLSTPLSINKNHKGTAFGGSLVTVLTTNCWLMAFKHFKNLDANCHIVIGKSEVEYKKPVTKDFFSSCQILDVKELEVAKEFFRKKGKSRIELEAEIIEDGVTCAKFKGIFFIFK